MLSVCCLSVPSVLSVCDVGVLWPNGWIDQGETWHGGRPRPRPDPIALDGDPAPPKRHSPQFLARVYCGQTVAHLSYC